MTTGTIWRAVGIVLVTLFAIWGLDRMRSLVMMLVVSLFFALALTPGVNYLHARRGWRRGAAVGVIYVAGIVAVVVMVVLIVPATQVRRPDPRVSGSQWMTGLDAWTSSKLGFHIVGRQAYKEGAVTVGRFLDSRLGDAAGGRRALSTGAGLVFEAARSACSPST